MLRDKRHKNLTPDLNKALDEVLLESAQRLSKITGLTTIESMALLTTQFTRRDEASNKKKSLSANIVTADESKYIAMQFA